MVLMARPVVALDGGSVVSPIAGQSPRDEFVAASVHQPLATRRRQFLWHPPFLPLRTFRRHQAQTAVAAAVAGGIAVSKDWDQSLPFDAVAAAEVAENADQ